MRRALILVVLTGFLSAPALAADEATPAAPPSSEPAEGGAAPPGGSTGTTPGTDPGSKTVGYKPPPPAKRIAGGRVDGGTRAARTPACDVKVTVVAPSDHVGLTLEAQPTLYFILSGDTSCPLEFVLNDRREVPPLVEAPVKTPGKAGLHAVRLADFGTSLEPEVDYDWYVQVRRSADAPSPEAYAGAQIRRTASLADGSVPSGLSGAARARTLADGSIWYDAVATISSEVAGKPGDAALRQLRDALFESVGLATPSGAIAP